MMPPSRNGIARQHRKHRAIKQADEQRADGMNDGRSDQRAQAKVRDLGQRRIGPSQRRPRPPSRFTAYQML